MKRVSVKVAEKINNNRRLFTIVFIVCILGGVFGCIYWRITQSYIYTENAVISATTINLSPLNSGILGAVLVHAGDHIMANDTVAQIGSELIKTKVDGIVTSTKNAVGEIFNRGETVVSMFDPLEMRVVGSIGEDKGLQDIKVGQRAVFTVDAFGSKKYVGIVDEISPIAHQNDIVFNISNKREIKEFDVKIRFEVEKYPEIKDGMSAKLWIYK